METYPNLYQMLESVKEADLYYDALPDAIQKDVKHHAAHLNSFEGLRSYVNALIRGQD